MTIILSFDTKKCEQYISEKNFSWSDYCQFLMMIALGK